MYINRLIDKHLAKWKQDASRKPLMLRGARQIGKSTTVRHLGDSFKCYVEVNFEEFPELGNLFNRNLDVKSIVENLAAFYNTPIEEGSTLLFFDEIQSCPSAINSLRYFYEKFPQLHVIAAGSLLEFALQDLPTFGVGRIVSMYMYPLSFDEFLMAKGETKLLEAKQNAHADAPLSDLLHHKLNEYLFKFILIGGMPEAVKVYIQNESLLGVEQVLTNLNLNFQTDFAKYKKRIPKQRIMDALHAVVQQGGGKFVLAKVPDTNSTQAREAIYLLQLAGLILPVVHSSANGIPLGAQANSAKAKMVLMDTGLYQNLLGLQLQDLLLDIKNIINKGALAESFWALEYIKYQSPFLPPNMYYWHREAKSANAEVDYVVQKGNAIIPIEIKSSTKGSMQSLRLFIAEKKIEMGYRFSLENFGQLEAIRVMPLYAVSTFMH
jgi:uncharacterized protein